MFFRRGPARGPSLATQILFHERGVNNFAPFLVIMRIKFNDKRRDYLVSDFENNDKITEIELLMHYNPKVINRKIKAMQSQINSLYHLNMSHVITNENDMLVSVLYPLDKLVIHIIDEKEKLDYYTKTAHERLHLLKNIIKNYTKREQNEVMKYMLSSGKARNQSVIERLKEDIYHIENSKRQERHNARIELHQKAFDRHLEQVKNDLSMNRKVLVMP